VYIVGFSSTQKSLVLIFNTLYYRFRQGNFPQIQTFVRGEDYEEVTASVSCCDGGSCAGGLCLRARHRSTYSAAGY
jgi:hypothetical protein